MTDTLVEGIAGMYDPQRSFEHGAAGKLLAGAFGDGRADTVAEGPFATARAPRGRTDATAATVLCAIAGRIHNLEPLGRAAGLAEHSGAEAIVAGLYAADGEAMLERLRGSFVLALWDGPRERGLLAEDQVGNRSLLHAAAGGRLHFASDLHPLLAVLRSRPSPNVASLVRWLGNSDLPAEETLHEGVYRLGAGHCLVLENGTWTRRRYWAPGRAPLLRGTRTELMQQFWDAVVMAVSNRLDDHESAGIVMSGGVDSSAVAAAASVVRRGVEPPRGYSAVFPGQPRLDESARIDLLTNGLGMPSVQVEVHPGGAFALSLDYLRTWELPLSGAGYVIEYPLLQLAAADGLSVVLDGQGGDEVLGLSPYLPAERLRRGRLLASLRLATRFPSPIDRTPRQNLQLWKLFALKGAVPYWLHERVRRLRKTGRYAPRWLNPSSARLFFEQNDPWAWKREPGPMSWAFTRRVLMEERERTGLAEYLRHRAAMAGLTTRQPLFDADLALLALRIPPELQFDPKVDRPLVRDAMRGLVPDGVRNYRGKSNLGPFYHEGVAEHDIPAIRRLLLAPDAEILSYANPDVIRELVSDPPPVGRRGWGSWLVPVWTLVTAECWLRFQGDPDFADRVLESPDVPRPRWTVVRSP